MEKLFFDRVDTDIKRNVLFFTLMVLTLGLAWFFYDDFLERTYMVNRRRLIKAIQNGEVSLVKRLPLDPDYFYDIEMYDLKHGEDTYDLWLWTREDGVIKAIVIGDYIGLFTSTFSARRLNDRLVKVIKQHVNG